MASALAYTLCIVLCICSLQSVVSAKKLQFVMYTQETRGGPNATLLAAAGTGAGNFSALGWGSFLTVDNLLKEGPGNDSIPVGRFTGVGVLSTKGGIMDGGILAIDQFRFGPASKYNGSTINVIGILASPLGGPWELTVVGGTGYFRGYKGYALSTPYLPTTVAPIFVFKWNFYLSN